jgi:hypothetical protein
MPYTISHVAAAVPFLRLLVRLRVLSAVVIGSMVPDFGYLMPIHPSRFQTHSAIALATFCLPVGMLCYWTFQRLMKNPLVNMLPDQAYMRWQPYSTPAAWGDPRQWLLAACGVMAGAVVHLAWDGFTHEDARGVRMLPELADPILEVHGHLLTGARLFQDLSSLLGLMIVIVTIVYALRPRGRLAVPPRALTVFERRTWALGYAIATLGFGAGFLILDHALGASRWAAASSAAIALLRALVLAALCLSVLLKARLHTKR